MVSFVAQVLGSLPDALRLWLVERATAQSPEEAQITDSLLDFHIANNCFYMAGTEMEDIKEVVVPDERSHSKFSFYFGSDNGWVPLEHAYVLESKLPKGMTMD